jgi:hypothetical protein
MLSAARDIQDSDESTATIESGILRLWMCR